MSVAAEDMVRNGQKMVTFLTGPYSGAFLVDGSWDSLCRMFSKWLSFTPQAPAAMLEVRGDSYSNRPIGREESWGERKNERKGKVALPHVARRLGQRERKGGLKERERERE